MRFYFGPTEAYKKVGEKIRINTGKWDFGPYERLNISDCIAPK